MRTSLVVKTFGGDYLRAARPEDCADPKLIPWYVTAHTAEGWNGKAKKWHQPAYVSVKMHRFDPTKTGVVSDIRTLDADSIARLERIDIEREELRRRLERLGADEQSILVGVWPLGNPITVDDVKSWKAFKEQQAKAAATV